MTPPSLEPLDEHKIYDELIQDKTLTGTLFQSQIRGIAKLICARFGASGQKGYDEKAMTVAYDSGYATGYEACKSGQRGVKFPSKVILPTLYRVPLCAVISKITFFATLSSIILISTFASA